jgi:hypothetical protein
LTEIIPKSKNFLLQNTVFLLAFILCRSTKRKEVIASKPLLLKVSNEMVNATINMLTTVRRKGKKRENQPSY